MYPHLQQFPTRCNILLYTSSCVRTAQTLTSLTHFISPTLAAPPPISIQTLSKRSTHNIQPYPPVIPLRPSPGATPCLARSSQTGSTTLGPSIPIFSVAPPARPSLPVPSIISAPRPPSHPHKGSQTKEKKRQKKGEKNTAATMQNSADRRTVFCPGPCLSSPGLSYKHTLFSGGTTAQWLGGWNRGVVLSKAL